MTRLKLILALPALGALAACSHEPAGTMLNQASFGQASSLTQTAQLADQTEFLRQLAASFRASVPTTVNFEFNRAELDQDARRVLDQQAAFIKKYPQIVFSVFGHTDLVGTERYNQRLGQRRARAAVNYMIRQAGVPRGQLRAVASRGEREPLVSTPGPERLNRRAVTDVTGRADARRRGRGMDGKRALIVYNEYVNDAGTEIISPE